MSIIYLDTETTGLDPAKHEIWEIAYAVDGAPIRAGVVSHSGISADAEALRINGYHDRGGQIFDVPSSTYFENDVFQALHGATLCAANPAFDAAFLKARWGDRAPWSYRLFDIEAYAMGALGYDVPQGLKTIAHDLTVEGHEIPEPDHTAAGDVATLRACHLALKTMYARTTEATS